MTDLPLHPLIVHFPVALAALMPFLAGGLLLAWTRGLLRRRGWWLAVILQAAMAASGFLAMRTGDADAERVERVVAEATIEEHEEAAEAFVTASVVVLLVFAGAALLRGERAARLTAGAAVLGTVAVLVLAWRAGHAGGELVYRHGAASAFTASPEGAPTGIEAHDDDDR